ncbi:MAG: phage portal protein [Holosporales bacterium]|jgi:HK97 family phage portal protein|nr:phage portal protein [Holosporales bacterium]
MLSRIFKNYVYGKVGDSKSALISYKTARTNSSTDYDDLSETGYKKNVVVYRCVQLISRALASVNWILQKTNERREVDEVLYNHEILDLMDKPNSKQYKTTFIEEAISYLLLSGNCFITVVRDDEDTPRELHLLRPDRVRIIPGKSSIPRGYEYSTGETSRLFNVDQETGQSDLLHIKLFNPLDDWYGMSPVEVAMSSINQHNAIAQQNTAFLQNGGRPSGALMYKSSIDPQKRNELRDNLRNLYEGGRNAGKILLLEGNFEWREMGLSPKDLDFISGKELSAKEIALAFGVPNILIGCMSSATFSNYKEARYNFWEETLIPLLNIVAGEFANWLQNIFKTEYRLWYDLDSIPALSKRRESEWKKINNAEFLTIDEKREAFGYSPIKKDPIIPNHSDDAVLMKEKESTEPLPSDAPPCEET